MATLETDNTRKSVRNVSHRLCRLALLVLILIYGTLIPWQHAVGQAPTEVKWTLSETDCQVTARNWQVTDSRDEYRSAPDSKQIHFRASWGTRAMASTPVTKAWVIDELKPAVWVKGTRDKVQLYARVVLPKTEDPLESGPMTVLLPGPVYESAGRWQKLDFADSARSLPSLLEEEVWKLRTRFKQKVDSAGAYMDMVVLNVYTGTGTSTVWVDDIEMVGAIAVEPSSLDQKSGKVYQDSLVRTVAFQQEGGSEFAGQANQRPALTQTNGTIFEVRGKPFFVRSIQHNGEPFEVLKNLGFNTIELARTATIQELRYAERLDVWLICPPPESAGFQPVSAEFDRVLAWSLGQNLDHSDLRRIETIAREVDESDFRKDRPKVAFAGSGLFELARVADVMSVGFEPIGGSFVLSQYSDWLQQRAELAQKSLPIWATLQTEMAASIKSQTAALSSRTPPMPLEASQLKFMAYEAIAGGARGMRFLSRSRLDAQDPVANLRSMSLRWLNAHLVQLESWISAGAVVNRAQTNDRGNQITTLATTKAKLVLIQRASQLEQLVTGDRPVSDFRFSDHTLSASEGAYHLSESGMIPLDQGRAMTGNEITVENCGPLEAILITRDSTVINRLAESYFQNGQETIAQMHLGIAQQWMTIVSLINEQLTRIGRSSPIASGSINEANNALRQAQALVTGGSALTANRLLYVADQKLAVARMNILATARNRFASQTSSPLLTHVSLVPMHFELVNRIDPQAWQPNGLAGGDFENLEHMTRNQWENHRVDDPGLLTNVELSSDNPVDGERALLMSVAPSQSGALNSLVDRTPLWIKSGPVPVKAGQLVRIHGWVKVDRPIGGSLDGLMIIDSIGGPQMAERISVTDGWQEFSIYRCPAQNTDVRLTFALTGHGSVLIDEVDMRVLDLGEGLRQAKK